jgi:N12 class adenine-specific DNA methylase/predicted ABC-type ATPase
MDGDNPDRVAFEEQRRIEDAFENDLNDHEREFARSIGVTAEDWDAMDRSDREAIIEGAAAQSADDNLAAEGEPEAVALSDDDLRAMVARTDLTPAEREQVNRALAARVKPADAPDLPADADPVDVRPTEPDDVAAAIAAGQGPAVGSWTTRLDPQANEGVITIKGDYGITGQIRSGIGGWVGWLGQRNTVTGYDDTEDNVGRGSRSVTDRDPQVVLDRLYDTVNGPGAADRTRNEVTQGRAPAPEVGREWTDLTDGARIRVTPHTAEYDYNAESSGGTRGEYVVKPTGDDPFDAVFVSYQRPSSYQPYGFVTYRLDGENENVQHRVAVPAGLRPEPAAPLLGGEAPEMYDSDDSDADYVPDPYAVPVLDRNSPRFVPTGLDDFAPAGVMAKVDANIAALRVLRALRTEGRPATPDEQATLARWAGWGGVAGVFDTDKPEFAARLAEIETLLDPVEMRRAKRTTVNAHYTDPRVVEQVWGALRGLGFDGGRVLEPGSGSGTFIGYRPEGTDMVGVEWDSTTAAISKYLYPDADIRNESFAETLTPDDAFDATIGNVPFGNFALTDTRHNRDGESIHNHFILKSLAMTRPGGIVAVMSSRYTLDSLNDSARRKMFEQADLVGAVRFPNGSHQRIAGTDVIEDLLIFRKRLPGEEPGDDSWLTSRKQDINGWEVSANDYFTDTRPDRVLGTLTAKKGRFGGEVAVDGDVDTPELGDVLAGIVSDAQEKGLTVSERSEPLPALLSRRLGRYEGNIAREDDGTYTIASSGAAEPFTVPDKGRPEFDALLGIRDALMALLDAEATDDPAMDNLRVTLNERYDAYVATYGPLNRFTYTANGSRKRAPIPRLFASNDPKGAVVNALESYTPPNREVAGDTGSASKASIFTTRGVAPRQPQTSADNPADALTLSMDRFGYVRLDAIAEMLGTDEADARAQLGTLVFEDPPFTDDEIAAAAAATARLREDPNLDPGDLGIGVESLREPGTLVPAAEYLSGNVRAKLAAARIAAAQDPKYRANIEGLQAVVPRDLGPDEIDAMLGASWIDAKTVEDFANHMLRVNSWDKRRAQVAHSGGSIWRVEGAGIGSTDARVREWGTDARPFHQILQSMLEQRSITVTKDGKQDLEATLAAQAKAEAIQERFREWVWEDPERTRILVARYNDQFNNLALRQYDGSGRSFEGMSEEWREKVQPHVKNAVERIVNEPTALLAHVVGAGKTAEMVMGTAELKRLGLARKPAIVVPNHLLRDFTREYLEIYPTARVLTAGQGMSAEERRTFVAQAAVGDWDVVIMTQGAFEGIPMSGEQIEKYIDREMGTMRAQLEMMSAEVGEDGTKANKRTIKAMENALLRAEEALRKKLAKQKDLGVSFEQTGIDYLMVDEAHEYSNLRTLSNIQGAGIAGSDRATDLHMKLEYIRAASKTGRVATFATGTPIRNTITQAYVMQRYMRPDLMENAGIHSFDQWAATFGQVVEAMELKPEGRGFRNSQRFASFRNVPEFLRMFHTFADVKMAEDLDLPRPDVKGGKAEVISVPPSDDLREYIRQLGDRADDVRQGRGDPTEDNMLKISTDGRKAALSMALVTDESGNYYPHEPGKLEAAADTIARVHEANKDKVYTNPKTGEADEIPGAFQIVFMDMGTPKSDKAANDEASVDDTDADFVAYDKLKAELVARGIPADKIRYMHEAKDDAQKAEMFAAARDGRISVLIGSSAKMGVGTNMQKRAKALHHIDAPWRPADVEQRDGRAHRQGNWHMDMGEDIEIYRYVTEGSFDAYMWQTLERKAKSINQVMRGTLDVREIEDVGDTALSYAEVKAIAVGNPDFLTLATGETLVTKLQRLQRSHQQTQTNMRAEIGRLTQQADILDTNALAFSNAAGAYKQATDDDGNDIFVYRATPPAMADVPEAGDITTRTEAGDALRRTLLAIRGASSWGRSSDYPVGIYNGLPLTAASDIGSGGERMVALSVAGLEAVPIARLSLAQLREGQSTALGLMSRLDNFTHSLTERTENLVSRAAQNRAEVSSMQARIGQPFAREGELNAWMAKVERLRAKIQRDDARAEGADIPFDPRIDSDQYDDPSTRASAETFVPPEVQPAQAEVLATSLMVGDTITIVTGEVSGTTGEGKIISKREAAGMTFITVEIDGVEYTRAFATDALVTKVGAADSVTGVKGLTFVRTLSVKGNRVVVEVKRASLWREELHPRDRNGRFIETGAEVRIWGGGTGTILGMVRGGRVRVKRDADQREVVLDAGNVTVLSSPDKPATPDVPDGTDVPAAPAAPATPDAPAAAPDASPDIAEVASRAPSGVETVTEAPTDPTATFTGPGGARAFLANGEDGEPAGFIQPGDDSGTLLRFNNAEEWADAVDEIGMTEDAADAPDAPGADMPASPPDAGPDADAAPDTPDTPGAPVDESPDAAEQRMAAADAAAGERDSFTDGPEDDVEVQQPGTYVPPADGPLTMEQVKAVHDQPGRPDGAGTIDDPIDVEGDLDKAATLLGEGKHVRLNKVEEVSIVLEKLATTAQEMEAAGAKAPDVDLCTITVPGTNLFCQQSKGIPRSQMPQLSGTPVPGSPADAMERNKRGRVNVTQAFLDRLEAEGIGVTEQDVPAASLKATQNQLNGAKVGAMMVAMRDGTMTDAPVFATRDGYVLDGHHRWAAKVGVDAEDGELGDVTQPVRMLDMEIGEALDFANAFSAEIGIQQAGVGEMNAPAKADERPDVVGTAKIGDTVDTLIESVGNVSLDAPDDTDLPQRLEQAGDEYDAAMESGDPRAKAEAFLNLQKTLTELNNALDTGGTEPERETALNDFATVVALFDANVETIFPPANAGGTDPGLEGKVLPDDVAADFLSNAGAEDLVNGGSAAQFLVKGEDGQWRLTVERQALHDAIVAGIIDEVPVSDNPTYNFFGGGPASGKGGITRMFPQLEENAAYINPDDMKFALPEMAPRARAKDPSASSYVHEESSYLAKVAQSAGFDKGINVTLDGTGDSSAKAVKKKLAAARAKGYTVDAYYVSAPIDVAVERAKWRAENGKGSDRGRAVPRSVIEHAHMAVSDIVPQVVEEFDTFVLFDTNVDFGRPPNLLARKEREKRLEIMMSGGWQEFLDKARYTRPTGSATTVKPVETPTIEPDPAEADSTTEGPTD